MEVQFKLNGLPRQVVADPKLTLLELLRDQFHLTGAKQACDLVGQCGACTVIMNGKAVRACLVKLPRLQGADVMTVEGLGTPDNPHLVQEAYVLSGAIQCGYCTPGLIMATKALLDKNPDPSVDEIKQALRYNLCRCTGYVKVIDAVNLAGRFIRGETTPDAVRPDPNGPKIGVSHPRPSSMAKACGTAMYTADIVLPGTLELAVVRSPLAHALIKGIDTAAAEKMPGVVGIMTAKDIKGNNSLGNSPAPDFPFLSKDKVTSVGDAIAIVAAFSRDQARTAAKAVRVDFEPLPVMKNMKEALAEGAPRINDFSPNLFYQLPVVKGDADAAMAKSAYTVEGQFSTQRNHQAPLEIECSIAYLEGEGEDQQLVVVGRSIDIHTHQALIAKCIGFENVVYEEAFAGGQFGIKVDVLAEAVTAAATLHLQRPTRYVPDMKEMMEFTSKRHPWDMHVKLGADKQGRFTGLYFDADVDKGAHQMATAIAIIERAVKMLNSAYDFPDVKGVFRGVYTNNAFGSAARGAGPPQQHFALETAINMLADKMGVDPLEMRLRNNLVPGVGTSATGGAISFWPFPGLVEAIRPYYARARKAAAEYKDGGVLRRGVGISGAGFSIGGPSDQAMAAVELGADGVVTIYTGAADPGEGNDSMLTQLVADVLNWPLNKIRLVSRNTAKTPVAGLAASSRITLMAGSAAVDGAEQLKAAMIAAGAETAEELTRAGKPTRYMGTRVSDHTEGLDPKTGQGPADMTHVLCLQMAEVEVNAKTGATRVLKMTTAVDAGTVIHPQNYEGQLEGGADQGVGWALREEYIPGFTKDWHTFKFPTILTSMEMEHIIRETPQPKGTRGSTGIGEMTLLATAPSVIAGIHDAVGVWICDLPATPDKVLAAMGAK